MIEFLETTRARFLVDDRGPRDAPVLFFVAGLGDDHTSWDPVVDAFPDYRRVTFDNRGVGASDTTPGPYSIELLANDAHDVCAELELGRVIAVGSSMGGAIVQRWLVQHPGEVRAAILTNTWAERDPFCDLLFEHWIDMLGVGDHANLMRSLMLFSYGPRYFDDHGGTDWSDASALNPEGFAAGAAACRGHDILSDLAEVTEPVLVIAGARDLLTRPELAAHLASAIGGSAYRELDAAHMTFQDAPAEWVAIASDWLRSLAPE